MVETALIIKLSIQTRGNFTVNNYVSVLNSIFTLLVTTYTLVSVIQSRQSLLCWYRLIHTVTITPSIRHNSSIVITASPNTPLLCRRSYVIERCTGSFHSYILKYGSSIVSSGPLTEFRQRIPASPYPSNITVSGLPTSGVTNFSNIE